ncbi:sensor histidine kinase [Agromyces sp. SYSU T0242]|uniref:sensor histidine kinase n=1 Tax=Agromyces litoreus TaxID=3158561 RepID=UPI003394EACE
MAPGRERPARRAASRVAISLVAVAVAASGTVTLYSIPAVWRARTAVCEPERCPLGSLGEDAAARLPGLGIGIHGYVAVGLVSSLLVAAACLAAAAFLLRGAAASPEPRGAITAAAALTAISVGFPQLVPALVAEHPALWWAGALVDASIVLLVWWVASFPDGVVRGWWGRALVVAGCAWTILSIGVSATGEVGPVVPVATGVVVVLVITTLVANMVTGDRERRRLTAGTAAALGSAFAALGIAAALQGSGLAPTGGAVDLALQPVLVTAFLAIPVAIASAVLRNGLWAEAAPVTRVVAAAATALAAVAIYVIGALGLAAAGAEPAVAFALPAALLGIVLPWVDRVSLRVARRALTGSDLDRRRLLAELGSGLALAATPSLAPDVVAGSIAEALGLRGAAIEVGDESGEHADGLAVPLVHAGRLEGRLVLEPRRPGERLDSAQSEALEPVCAQLAAVLHGRRLARELDRSRRALLAAREDERRRIRDDLHDELGPTLAAATLTLGAAEREAAHDPGAAVHLVGEARQQVTHAVDDVRRIVRGLRPPALDDIGLVGAVRAYADAMTGPVRVEVKGTTPALSAATEAAAYAIALEAISNAVRHSGGSRCTVSLEFDAGQLVLRVADDGHGPGTGGVGVGSESMARRARELGGRLEVSGGTTGTTVVARIPGAAVGVEAP